jgi:hypothetical protein
MGFRGTRETWISFGDLTKPEIQKKSLKILMVLGGTSMVSPGFIRQTCGH